MRGREGKSWRRKEKGGWRGGERRGEGRRGKVRLN